ncbi:NAD(P)-binding protein [Mytilinidion resinicola]|uniref:NAD(P)-binding protein n=1 Tax=Mytilinidion resinicola TaxID=574789 RepID=A0A6A6YZY3_9PEZI|nr:NAD(P)-binding protein [Mytilinidion resinicola]KAF2814088.1 NAD(P)-binding protein [Mytilinidion resinicola]
MPNSQSVFLIGPGFVGWNVLDLLLAEGYPISALVRRPAHAAQIAKSGVTPIIGDLDDHALISAHTASHDITIHTATADHVPSVAAVIAGIQQRKREGKKTIFIHTSGTGVLDDGAWGAFKGDKIYYDNEPAAIDALPDTAAHRDVDLTIVRASKEIGEAAKMVIMIPPEIYGFNPAHRRLTVQLPMIARLALKRGWVGHVGKGLAVESQVHVLDLARAYVVLLHHMERTPSEEFLANPYFFCENGREFSWKEVAEHIGEALYEKGLIKDKTPRTFGEEDYGELWGEATGNVFGLNSRSRAVRLRELGWEPREKSIWESFKDDELPEILKGEGLDGFAWKYSASQSTE